MAATTARLAALRWPNGVACCWCGSKTVAARGPRGWRCRSCRRDFSVTSRTVLHGSKLGLEVWEAAAHSADDSPIGIASAAGVSEATARKISRVLRSVGLPAGESRLKGLLSSSSPADASRARGPRLSSAEQRLLNVLRVKPLGAEAALVAELASVSVGHARRCLRRLREARLVELFEGERAGRDTTGGRLWRLAADSARIIERLPALCDPAARPPLDRVPVEFWDCFWSGTPPQRLSVSRDGLYIAEALINGRDPHARAWALGALPLKTLEECRKLRGCDTGAPARWLANAIRERSRA